MASASSSAAKRQKTNHVSASLKPELSFKQLKVDQPPWKTGVDSDKLSAHADSAHNLYVSDTSNIVCFARNGSCRPVINGLDPHHIVPNSNADHVVILRKSDKQKLSKVTPIGVVETIVETSQPLYGPDVCPNGDIVHHPSTSRLERRGPNGDLLASIEGGRGKVISFEANSYLTAGQDGHVYFSSKTCVYRWNHHEKTVECIAGHPKAAGKRDGFGTDARFTHLKRPVLTRRFAYVRESNNRFCRISLETFEVVTLQMQGVGSSSIETYGVTPDGMMMFVVVASPFRIFTAETTDALESTLCADMRQVNWQWQGDGGVRPSVQFIAGKDRKVYSADGRVLVARSAYFNSMLLGGMREGRETKPIDLGEDISAEAMDALFHFLYTDHFEPVSPPSRVCEMQDEDALKFAKLALEVHTLADRFILPRLARLSEVFLSDFALRASIIIPLLATITIPPKPALGKLENACWEFLEANWQDIQHNHERALQELIETSHPLALSIMQASIGVKRGSRAKTEEESAEGS